MRFSVYSLRRRRGGNQELIPLGYVNAATSSAARSRALGKWIHEADVTKVGLGFIVHPYSSDPHSLGKAKRREYA